MVDLPIPRAGLRPPGVRVRNRTADVAKVLLVIPAGGEVEADATVADQLLRTGAFEPAAVPPSVVMAEEAGGGSARRASGRRGVEG